MPILDQQTKNKSLLKYFRVAVPVIILLIVSVFGGFFLFNNYPKSKENINFSENKALVETSNTTEQYSRAENTQTLNRTTGKEQGKVAIVKGTADGYLNLRNSPTIDGEVIESAFRDDKVIILEQGKEWSKVRYKDKIGYMATEFLIIK